MKLISELVTESVTYSIEESATGEKKWWITGPFIAMEQKNKNGRIYPAYIDDSIQKYINEKIRTNRAYGELNHPNNPTINLDKVSHRITELRKEGNNWHGKAMLADTPMGQIAKGLLSAGGALGISTRGMGSLKPNNLGEMVVQPDYHLVTAGDLVSDPSGPGCFVSGIMEDVSWFYDEKHGWIAEKSEETKKCIKKMSSGEIEKNKLRLFEDYLNFLTK